MSVKQGLGGCPAARIEYRAGAKTGGSDQPPGNSPVFSSAPLRSSARVPRTAPGTGGAKISARPSPVSTTQ
jgi:hypothetical protein